ncbi:MAG: ACP S-malonyltransferase [Proteobacteria bacterium]|nr:ACP S-malonyltransferase [Pseudomonadota bacterium]
MPRAFVFPGQGSHAAGMGEALAAAFPVAREMFEEIDEALKQNLTRLMFQGPEDELVLTENAQPALMAVSLATVRVLVQEGGIDLAGTVAFVAGHSLGEYSALAAAGALRLDEAARLLKARGRAMQEAVPVGEGAMAAVIGLDLEAVREIAARAAGDGVCVVANDNAPDQAVVSGNADAVKRAVEIASEQGARRTIMLPVSAPFHCALMAPAAEAMAEALAEVELKAPVVPLIANVTAEPVEDPETIRELLVEQVTAMVRWRESVVYLKNSDVDTLVELGAGKVLTGLARRIDPELTAVSVSSPEDIEAFLKTL